MEKRACFIGRPVAYLEDALRTLEGWRIVAVSSPLFFVGLVSGIAVFAVVTTIDGGVVFFRAIHGSCRGGHLALFTAKGILILGGRRFSIFVTLIREK